MTLSAILAGSVNGRSDGTLPILHLTERYGLDQGTFDAASLDRLRGRPALVTGASSGLGLGVARALAKVYAELPSSTCPPPT